MENGWQAHVSSISFVYEATPQYYMRFISMPSSHWEYTYDTYIMMHLKIQINIEYDMVNNLVL